MSKLNLTIACRAYDRVSAIATGEIGVEGCDVTFVSLPAEEIFQRANDRAEFDVSELSMSSHIVMTERGTSRYLGLPIFISRMFVIPASTSEPTRRSESRRISAAGPLASRNIR